MTSTVTPPTEPWFGFELELEEAYLNGERLCSRCFTKEEVAYFTTKDDGSLRGEAGVEIVFRKPFNYEESMEALEVLSGSIRSRLTCKQTPRCSMHYHVSLPDTSQLAVLSALSLLLEGFLFEFVDVTRQTNEYSRASWNLTGSGKQQFVANALVAALADNDTWINYDPSGNMSKYEAINLTSLRSYGSVEFRMCPATLELDHTSGFLKILNSIAVLASRTSVEEMIGMIMQPEEEEVLVKLLNQIHFGDVFLSGDKQSLNNKVYGGSDLLARFCECRKQIAVRIRIGKA